MTDFRVTTYDGATIESATIESRITTVDGGELVIGGGSGGEGTVTSVNTIEPVDGDVTLTAGDVGADPAGTASSAVAAHAAASDPHPQYLTNSEGGAAYDALGAAATAQSAAVAAAATDATTKADAAQAAATTAAATDATSKAAAAQAYAVQRTNHTGTQAISTVTGLQTALDGKETAGAAATAQAAAIAASQPVDSDLTAIAALTTTTFGRSLLTQADAAALRSTAGLGTAATQAATAFDSAGAAAAAQAASQPLDSDLTAIAALTTTSFGRSFLALADAAAARTLLGLGTAATVNTGTSSGDVPLLSTGGRLPIARIASGTADGTKFVRDDGTLATPSGGATGARTVLTYSGGAYPTRTGGTIYEYVGPTEPSTWQSNDTWIKTP